MHATFASPTVSEIAFQSRAGPSSSAFSMRGTGVLGVGTKRKLPGQAKVNGNAGRRGPSPAARQEPAPSRFRPQGTGAGRRGGNEGH